MSTERPLVWLDLCSGLGGASQPALDRGWRVIRVDIDPRFKPDIVADVRALPLKPFHVDVLWASPPCQDFIKSQTWLLRNPRNSKGQFERSKDGSAPMLGNRIPDTSIVRSIHRMIFFDWKFRFWCVENTLSSREFITPILGPVASRVPGHVFWGRLPCLLPDTRTHKNWKAGPNHGKSSAERAKIPYEIGSAICAAVERRAEEAA